MDDTLPRRDSIIDARGTGFPHLTAFGKYYQPSLRKIFNYPPPCPLYGDVKGMAVPSVRPTCEAFSLKSVFRLKHPPTRPTQETIEIDIRIQSNGVQNRERGK